MHRILRSVLPAHFQPQFVVTDAVKVVTTEPKHAFLNLFVLAHSGLRCLKDRSVTVMRVVFHPLRMKFVYGVWVAGHGTSVYWMTADEIRLISLEEDMMREHNLLWADAHPNSSIRYTP